MTTTHQETPVNLIKLGADGAQLPTDAKDHVAVLDTRTNLMWTAHAIAKTRFTWNKSKKACEELSIAGFNDWRLPEVEELFVLCDRTRFNPAIDPDFFPGVETDWYWTATVDASDPSSCAWYVLLYDGSAGCGSQSYGGRVLACRRAAPARQ